MDVRIHSNKLFCSSSNYSFLGEGEKVKCPGTKMNYLNVVFMFSYVL